MTPQEQQMIDGLIGRVRATEITDRDPEAAARLQRGLGDYPDAIYVLAQTVLVQQNALEQAHEQMEELEGRSTAASAAPQASSSNWQALNPRPQQPAQSGWLSRFFGAAPQTPLPANAYAPSAAAGYPASNPWSQPQYGGGSFLRSAAQTAAGVAAGELLFSGLEGMFGGARGGGFTGGGGGTTIINEYGDHGNPERSGEHHTLDGNSDGTFYNPSHDASRQHGESASRGFADTASTDGNDDFGDYSGDDLSGSSAQDDASFDDGGDSFDGGSDDSGF